MKKTILSALAILVMGASYAQQQEGWCMTDKVIEKQISDDPNFKQVLHNSMMRAAEARNNGLTERATYTIPTVFHIIHDNGVGNISQAQIDDAMRILNEDYRRENADTSDTRNNALAPFVDYAGSMDVEFILAKLDPNGNCTNGVVRVNAPNLTYNAGESCKSSSNGGSSPWDQTRYLNIWVVNSIDNDGEPGIILGYAYLPYGGMNNGFGILIRNDATGTIETAAGSDGRTLTHEMGHTLGLSHIFQGSWWGGGDGCHTSDCSSNGDYCCDTPTQQEAFYNCNSTWNSCTTIPAGDSYGFDTYDQIENYMSYNACQNMFSIDQVGIMEFNLNDVSWLDNMVTNAATTGVFQAEAFCLADFDASGTDVCPGSVVDFTDFSFYNPTNWTWSVSPGVEGVDYNFVGGTGANSQNPSIEFVNAGSYDISLTSGDGITSDSETKTGFINVLPNANQLDLIEGFEGYTDFASTDQWTVYNPAGSAWEITTNASHTGSKSARLFNFGQPAGRSDELISAPVDLSVIDAGAGDEVTLSFRYAYRKRYASNTEWLKVFVSANCGETWAQRKTLFGDLLSPLTYTSSWTPAGLSDWTTVHMTNITSAYHVDNFLYKFEFESDGGNNFYLDNINIYAGPPSEELVGTEVVNDDISGYNLFPNPVDDQLNVRFEIAGGSAATVELLDVTGKLIDSHDVQAAAGSNLVVLNTAEYAAGVYMVKLTVGSVTQVEQLIIE